MKPSLRVFGAQSREAPAQYESWKARQRLAPMGSCTFAEGIATTVAYELTFDQLCNGLAGFVTVPDADIAQAVRDLWRVTHNLIEGAGAVGFAGLQAMAAELRGETVAVVLSGGNLSSELAVKILAGEL